MARLEIRPFTLADVPFGFRLTEGEGWHRAPEDWARLVRLEPRGAFKATLDGRGVGTAAAVSFGKVAWIHSMIVVREFRGHGIGEALLRACLDYLDGAGVATVKLDSVGGVEPFYEQFGFRREYPSWRFLRDGQPSPARAAPLRPMDWRDMLLFDRRMTGLDRQCALQAILRDHPYESHILRDRGSVRGYVIVRRSLPRRAVGPCVAVDSATAADLLRAVLDAAPTSRFRACVGGANREAGKVFEELGFTHGDPSTRMARGEPFEESPAAFAMISAEKG